MFVYTVAPLVKIKKQEEKTFFYYGSEKLEKGALIMLNFKNRLINGIVLESKPLFEKKLELKKSDFLTKKILKIISRSPVVSDWQIKLARWVSDYYIHSFGDSLRLFVPKSLLKKKKEIILNPMGTNAEKNKKIEEISFVFGEKLSRWKKYLNLIKKRENKILILFPEIIQLKEFENFVKTKIKNLDLICFSSKITIKKELEIWEKTRNNEFDLIIGTRSAIFLPFDKIDLFIIDEEENPSYKSWDMQPRYDSRTFAEKLANIKKIKLIKGTEIPNLKIFSFLKQKELTGAKKIKFPKINIIETKKSEDFLSEKIISLMETNKKNKKFVFFVNRRGLAPIVLCQDCGYSLKCPDCELSLVLTNNILYCNHCSFTKKIDEICPKCGSWRLKTIGFGAEKIKKELEKIVDKEKIEIFDTYNLLNTEEQKKIIEKFNNSEIKYLIATPLILKFSFKADFGIIVSAEQFLNFPEFQIYEKNIQRFLKFGKNVKNFFIQTQNKDNPFFEVWKKSSIEKFYEEELEHRKKFSYPPLAELVKIINMDINELRNKQNLNDFIKELKKIAINNEDYEILGPNPCFTPKIKNKFCWNVVIKIKKNSEITKKDLFKTIPDNFIVDVEPETLL